MLKGQRFSSYPTSIKVSRQSCRLHDRTLRTSGDRRDRIATLLNSMMNGPRKGHDITGVRAVDQQYVVGRRRK